LCGKWSTICGAGKSGEAGLGQKKQGNFDALFLCFPVALG